MVSLVLAVLAMARPIDHDESQYVAATVLAQHGLPYRDFAYLQTPLQPLLLAPIAAVMATFVYPGLRLLNALFGTVILLSVYVAARRAGASVRTAFFAAAMLGCCDIFLFSVGVARNDALPAMLLALALAMALHRPEDGGSRDDGQSRRDAALIGLLLAAATAAKISYALPAIAYGGWALANRRARPIWVALGAVPVALFVLRLAAMAPDQFVFQVLTFPSAAPAEWYQATGRAAKLTLGYKVLDSVKFLALGPALLALAVVARHCRIAPVMTLLGLLVGAGLAAGLIPSPTWRQYLLPILPALFVALAVIWERQAPGRMMRILVVIFACAGVAPTIDGLRLAGRDGLPMITAFRHSIAIRRVMDLQGVSGPVATLSPQYVPATGRTIDPYFATGPFYFRSHGLLDRADEGRNRLVSADHFNIGQQAIGAIMVGGERSVRGQDRLDLALERRAIVAGWRKVIVPDSPFCLYLPGTPPAR